MAEKLIIELNNKELIDQLKLIAEVNLLTIFKEKNDLRTNILNSELSCGNAKRVLIIEEELRKRLKL